MGSGNGRQTTSGLASIVSGIPWHRNSEHAIYCAKTQETESRIVKGAKLHLKKQQVEMDPISRPTMMLLDKVGIYGASSCEERMEIR